MGNGHLVLGKKLKIKTELFKHKKAKTATGEGTKKLYF